MKLLPLHGVRVLDLTRMLAGPLCTMLFGDLGADVIKVERPGRGDDTREWGPPFDSDGESAYYLSTNRNRLGVAADLTSDSDRQVVLSLMGAANVVVQAESGWMAITGDPEGVPVKAGVALADVIAGKDAAVAILAALAGRARGTEIERHIVISLADSARAALGNVAQNALVSGADASRWGNAHANLVPYQLFQAKDRPIVIAVGTDEQWLACVRARARSSKPSYSVSPQSGFAYSKRPEFPAAL